VTLRFEVVSDFQRFLELDDRWQALWDRSEGFVFQSHAWLAAWIGATADQKEYRLLIALAWSEDELVGVFPCAIQRRSGFRVLQWAAQRFSDYCDCLIAPGFEAAIPRLWNTIRQAGGFDLISLQQVRPDAQCMPWLETQIQPGGSMQRDERLERCMRIENQWPTGDAFFRSLNKKGRNNHTRGKRILSELGGDVAFEVIEPARSIDQFLDTALAWKLDWLRVTDPTSLMLGPELPVFRALLTSAWGKAPTRLFILTCNGRMVALSFNFVYRQKMEAYFTAYDPAFERASPGTILIVDYAQWSFDRGLRHVDFLRGEEPFKFRLSNAETVIGYFSGARTLMGHVAVSGHRWLARRRQKATQTEQHAVLEAAD
jgi:CelD/BcsL family acetyltransferase involved in cellulose biosynthesis